MSSGKALAEKLPSRQEIVDIVAGAIERRQPPEEPFMLANAGPSWVYADVKRPLSSGSALRTVGRYAVARLQEAGVGFSAVGGLTMGATPLAIAISMVAPSRHFEVCKEAETKYSVSEPLSVVGTRFIPGDRLLVTEDTTSTGGSAEKAISVIQGIATEQQIDDVEVVGVCTVLDRGRAATVRFAAQDIAFIALTTFEDFGLEPLN